MPEFHYLDNQNDALRSTANALGGLSAQIPYLRVQAERIRQQRALDQARSILYGALTERAVAGAKFDEARTHDVENKTKTAQDIATALRAAGNARSRMYLIQSSPPMQGPTMSGDPVPDTRASDLTQAMADYLRNATIASGNNQYRGEQGNQQAIAGVTAGLQNNPNLSAAILTNSRLEHNIPPNNVSQNAMTGQITPGAVNVPAAGTVVMPGQAPVLGQQRTGSQISLPDFVQRQAVVRAAQAAAKVSDNQEKISPGLRERVFKGTYDTVMGAIGQSLGGTKAPPPGAVETNAQRILNRARTQSLAGTNAPVMPSASGLPSSKRIRVQSKDGRTGTMDSSEPLPEGWSIIQ